MDDADRAALSAALDPDDDEALDHILEHFGSRSYRGRAYWVLPDVRHGVERGTVVIGGEVVRGFPKIHRTLVLDPGVPEHFDGEVAVEEKLNGYNVRIASVDAFDEPVAFTRSGLICPYTTSRARELLDLDAFFADHPEKFLCGELVGTENPYTAHEYPEVDSHDVFVFDVRECESGRPMAVSDRRDLVDDYGFRQPRLLATGAAAELPGELEAVIEELDANEREGVVMKSRDGTRQLKYTAGHSNRSDLAHAFALPFDYGQDFLFSRIIREGFQSVEFEEDDAERAARARELGESILFPLVEAIETVESGDSVGEHHEVRGDPAVIYALLDHFESQGLQLEVTDERETDAGAVIEFTKHAASSTDKIRSYLDGSTYAE